MNPHDSPLKSSFPEERRGRIVAELERCDQIRVDQLIELLDVSPETVRRDLLALERRGLLQRVHGGALRPSPRSLEAPYGRRQVTNAQRKQAMARAAAKAVSPGDTVVLDVGTSVAAVANELRSVSPLRVLTCSLVTASTLAGCDGIDVMASGGRVRAGDLACSGPDTISYFRNFYPDKAFLGSGGISATVGLTDYHVNEIAVRQVILNQTRECYVLADSTKLGQVAVGRVCALDQITAIITDTDADTNELQALQDAGVRVLLAPLPKVLAA